VLLSIQFCCTETGNCSFKAQMLRWLCSLIKEWSNTVRYVTAREMECLERSCGVSDNEDSKPAFHAAGTCEGNASPSELLEFLPIAGIVTRNLYKTRIYDHSTCHIHSMDCVWPWALTHYFLPSRPIQSTRFFLTTIKNLLVFYT
jgi:hypothetical protein